MTILIAIPVLVRVQLYAFHLVLSAYLGRGERGVHVPKHDQRARIRVPCPLVPLPSFFSPSVLDLFFSRPDIHLLFKP